MDFPYLNGRIYLVAEYLLFGIETMHVQLSQTVLNFMNRLIRYRLAYHGRPQGIDNHVNWICFFHTFI